MNRSTAQFNLRPGVGGVPPIVSAPRNWKWFAAHLVPGDPVTVVVNEGRVYRGTNYAGGAAATLVVDSITGETLTLAETAIQYVVLEIDETVDEVPIQSLLTPATEPDLGASFGYTVEAEYGDPPESLSGAQSKASVVTIGTNELKVVTTLNFSHVLLAEITQTSGGYTLKQRHDGAVFIFPAVWPLSQTINW